jgi:predicted HD phosphohydrolase
MKKGVTNMIRLHATSNRYANWNTSSYPRFFKRCYPFLSNSICRD